MGRQFANDSMTPSPIGVSRNKYQDEMPSDKPMHDNSTPGHSNSAYTGMQYSDDFNGGYSGYGVSVGSGSGPSREQVTVNAQSTERGKES